MKQISKLIIFIFILSNPGSVFCQDFTLPKITLADKIDKVRIRCQNQEHLYTWDRRIEVTENEKVMDVMIENIEIEEDGKLQTKILNDESANLPKFFLAHKIAEDEKKKMEEYFSKLKDFLHDYSLHEKSKMVTFINNGSIDPSMEKVNLIISGKNIIISGDRLIWWVNASDYQFSKISVQTTFEGDEVEFTATFKTLADDFNYIAFAEVAIPSKGLLLQIHNYDYVKMK